MPITPEALRLEQQLRGALDQVLDQQTRDLVAAWATAWDEIAPDLDIALAALLANAVGGHVSRALMLRNRRLQKALAVIAQELDRLATDAGIRIAGDIHGIVDQAGRAQAAIIAAQLPNGAGFDLESWSRVDPAAIAAIVQRSTEQITAAHYPIGDDAYDAVRRELIRGVAAGSNPNDTAARMLRRAEGRFNGGLSRAINIARTETVDAHRKAAKVGQDRHADILQGWIWLAHLNARTCQACLGMHGRLFPLEEPGPHGHQQCRCSRAPKTRSWAELGYPGLDEGRDATPDADLFFRTLSPTEQEAILGRDRYHAWVAGEFPREEWAKRQENGGWRDSYVPAKPGEAGSGGPPTPPPVAPGGADDRMPPIGPVLGSPEQQQYLRAGEPPPRDFQLAADANWAWTFIPDPDDRATAMLMYDTGSETLTKQLAKAMRDGVDPSMLWTQTLVAYYRHMLDSPEFGITATTYGLDDLQADVTAAASRVLRWNQSAGPLSLPHLKGIQLDTSLNIDDPEDLAALVRLVSDQLGDTWLSSAAPVLQIAKHYANRWPDQTPIILMFTDADGIRLSQVGRMSMHPEALISGAYETGTYTVQDGVVFIEVRRAR